MRTKDNRPARRGIGLRSILSLLTGDVRRGILAELACGRRDVSSLAKVTGRSVVEISQGLKALRQKGLVKVERDGRRRIYDLTPVIDAQVKGRTATIRLLASDGSVVGVTTLVPSKRR